MKKEDRLDPKEMEDRRGSRNSDPEDEIRYFSVPSRKGGARTLQVEFAREKGKREESGGKNEEGPDASMKSHVPSRVHRNVAGRLAVSGHARACWWSPVFSSAQVDATRAPHGRRARGTAERRGGEGGGRR